MRGVAQTEHWPAVRAALAASPHETNTSIGRRIGVAHIVVWRQRRHMGIPQRPVGRQGDDAKVAARIAEERAIAERRKRIDARDARIVAALKTGETQAAVGKRYGISRQRVEQIARAGGVARRRA